MVKFGSVRYLSEVILQLQYESYRINSQSFKINEESTIYTTPFQMHLSHSQAQSAKIILIGEKLIHLGKFGRVFLPNFMNYHFLGFLPSILKINLAR